MDNLQNVAMRTSAETRKMLKIIAAHTDKRYEQILNELLRVELDRLTGKCGDES